MKDCEDLIRMQSMTLEGLNRLTLREASEEPLYDDVVQLAAQICDTPIALVGFIDEHYQWLKAKIGTDLRKVPRELSFCSHTILQKDILIVEDLSLDPRFSENPLVKNAPHLRFYAGLPIINQDGLALGAICVLDVKPRVLSAGQIKSLHALQRQLVRDINRMQRNSIYFR